MLETLAHAKVSSPKVLFLTLEGAVVLRVAVPAPVTHASFDVGASPLDAPILALGDALGRVRYRRPNDPEMGLDT